MMSRPRAAEYPPTPDVHDPYIPERPRTLDIMQVVFCFATATHEISAFRSRTVLPSIVRHRFSLPRTDGADHAPCRTFQPGRLFPDFLAFRVVRTTEVRHTLFPAKFGVLCNASHLVAGRHRTPLHLALHTEFLLYIISLVHLCL
jgi:hypothetical protein